MKFHYTYKSYKSEVSAALEAADPGLFAFRNPIFKKFRN